MIFGMNTDIISKNRIAPNDNTSRTSKKTMRTQSRAAPDNQSFTYICQSPRTFYCRIFANRYIFSENNTIG